MTHNDDASAIQFRVRPARGEPEGALVLFHGRGTDENDLFPLLDILDPEARLIGATPRGPLSLPPGGAHWYVVRQVGYPDPSTFLPTYQAAGEWLDEFSASTGVPFDRTILGGFSQGAVMTYALGLGAGRPRVAALMPFSGFIPTLDGFEVELEALDGFPVAIGHGTYDPVISVDFSRDAAQRLRTAGADVVYRESPMEHSIDPGFLAELRPWVASTISKGPARSTA